MTRTPLSLGGRNRKRATPLLSDDLELVEQARAGDETAMSELYHRHHQRLARVCVAQLGGDRVLASELAHDALVRSWERLGQFSGDRFDAWVTTIARRLCVDHHRRSLRDGRVDRGERFVAPDPAETIVARDGARLLWEAIDDLPSRQATAVRIRLAGGSSGEVATALQVDPNAANQVLHRARSALRSRLLRLRCGILGVPGFRYIRLREPRPSGVGPERWWPAAGLAAAAVTAAGFTLGPARPAERAPDPPKSSTSVPTTHARSNDAGTDLGAPSHSSTDELPMAHTAEVAPSDATGTRAVPVPALGLGVAAIYNTPEGAAYVNESIDCMPLQFDVPAVGRFGIDPVTWLGYLGVDVSPSIDRLRPLAPRVVHAPEVCD